MLQLVSTEQLSEVNCLTLPAVIDGETSLVIYFSQDLKPYGQVCVSAVQVKPLIKMLRRCSSNDLAANCSAYFPMYV